MEIKKSLAVFLICTALIGCGGSGSSSGAKVDICNELSSETFSCDDMLNDLVVEGVRPIVLSLKTQLAALDNSVAEYCGDITDEVKLLSAQNAWSAVMAPLQQLQVMNFGPNAKSDTGLLPLYDWQTAHPINIDTAIAQNALASEDRLSSIDNEKDLVAVEYILFDYAAVQTGDLENPNTVAWRTNKTDAEIQQDRCDYANLVTSSLKSHSVALNESWLEFDLLSSFSTKQAAANKVAEALFYVDKITKDRKIKSALPQDDTGGESIFDETKLESQFARESKEAILNNLDGVLTMLTLNDNDNSKSAINDYLVAAGQADVAVEMTTALITATANVGLIVEDLNTVVGSASDETTCKNYSSGSLDYLDATSDIEYFCASQYNVKNFTDILKGDFTLLTSFTIPASASGDND